MGHSESAHLSLSRYFPLFLILHPQFWCMQTPYWVLNSRHSLVLHVLKRASTSSSEHTGSPLATCLALATTAFLIRIGKLGISAGGSGGSLSSSHFFLTLLCLGTNPQRLHLNPSPSATHSHLPLLSISFPIILYLMLRVNFPKSNIDVVHEDKRGRPQVLPVVILIHLNHYRNLNMDLDIYQTDYMRHQKRI